MFKLKRSWVALIATLVSVVAGSAAAQDISRTGYGRFTDPHVAVGALGPDGLVLRKAVLLMRHGVRPPTDTTKFQPYAAQPFPTWDVPDGYLTGPGATLVSILGGFERQLYATQGLLAPTGCPRSGDLFVWADSSSERTLATGQALVAGLYPNCGLSASSSSKSTDTLFSTNFPLDTNLATAAVMARMGGTFQQVQQLLNPLLTKMGNVLQCCSVSLCQQQVGRPNCTFTDLPWSLSGSGGSLSLNGPLATGSSIAQVFQLEYENGFVGSNVAFGRATAADVVELEGLYTSKYYYFDRTPILARNKGSNIANQMLLAVKRGAGLTSDGPPAARLTVYVGHDGQLSALGGMLDLHWQPPSVQPDDTIPGGALGFELFSDAAQQNYYVRTIYLAQTLEQMHQAQALSFSNMPSYITLKLNGCDLDDGRLCTLNQFINIMTAAIDPAATATYTYK